MQKPIISIIVPCYNVERYLQKCINSILNQTYTNLEIILVDDGSPDNCGKICDSYAKIDSRIKVIHKLNGGLSDARNVAIDLAKGEFITFIDSDDFITPDYIETLYNLCKKHNCKLAVANWQIFTEGDNKVTIPKTKVYDIILNKKQALEDMFYQVHFDVSACVKLYHRSLFDGIRFPVDLLFEDLQTTFKLILRCDCIAYTNKQIYFYMFRNDSIEGSKFSENKMNSAISVFNTMKSYAIELEEVTEALKCRLISFCFHLLLKMPNGYRGSDVLYHYIKENRLSVIRNTQARKKTRIACFVSYFGFKNVKRLFSFIDRRKINN